MLHIRQRYEEEGSEGYYKNNALAYQNPHEPQVRELILRNIGKIDYTRALDLCAGGGEVSKIWHELGHNDFLACDAYTYELYEQNLQRSCYQYSFDNFLRNKFSFPHTFSTIVCSFALHLCPEDWLFNVTENLFAYSPEIVIITPHKRPELELLGNCSLRFEDFVLTERGKKVRLKAYCKIR
jgi:hypothetical protein